MEKKSHLLLIDGMALLFRSFFATAVRKQYMRNSKGMPTNAVQGYMKHLLTAVDHIKPTHAAVCWDMGSTTFRTEMFNGYKANREAPPAELIPQFDIAKDVTAAFELPSIGLPGYEADDCIGTIARNEKSASVVSILTGDRDLLQLLDEQVDVYLMQKGYGNYARYTNASFEEECGITPAQFVDVKALMGDASDGYPGVKGIGEKTAFSLIREFGSIESILENLDRVRPAVRTKIERDMDMLMLSRKLAEIKCDVPLQFSLIESERKAVPETARNMIRDLELKSIAAHLVQSRRLETAEIVFGKGV